MADILLTHSNHLFFDAKQIQKMQPYPPLQTLIAAELLRREGHSVTFFDSTFETPAEGLRRAIERRRPGLIVVAEDNFNFLTKMCLVRNREVAFEFAALALAAGIPIVINGSDSTDRAAEYLSNGFDYVIAGELEESLLELCRNGVSGSRDLAGLSWKEADGAVRRAAPRRPAPDLSGIPGAAWDLVDIGPYRESWLKAHGHFSLNLVSSRGCPYRCNWCAKPIYGGTYRFHPAAAVAGEMRRVKDAYAPDQIWFADDIFALSRKWTALFADAVEELDARVPFKMQSRCDLMTRPTVSDLRRAGCAEVWMGAESGSQRILDAMDKDIAAGSILEACDNLRSQGIRACLFLQFGYPGETWEDIKQTVNMVRAARPDDVGISVSYPLPNTRLHEMVSARLGGKTNWTDSGDLDLMFQGAYDAAFYRALADAIHQEVRHGMSSAAGAWNHVEQLEPISRNRAQDLPILFAGAA